MPAESQQGTVFRPGPSSAASQSCRLKSGSPEGVDLLLRVSVIIPALNEEVRIQRSIESAHTAGACEVIVVDGGSSDRTVEIARQMNATVQVTKPGRAEQQNSGASLASGDVLLFLHADCRLAESSVREISSRLVGNEKVIAGCFRQRIDRSGCRYRALEAGNLWRVRILKWAYGDQGIFVRREVFEAIGGFAEVQLMEDLLLMKTLKRRGSIIILDSPLTVSARRWENRGVLSQTIRNWSLVAALHMGVSTKLLRDFYPNDR